MKLGKLLQFWHDYYVLKQQNFGGSLARIRQSMVGMISKIG